MIRICRGEEKGREDENKELSRFEKEQPKRERAEISPLKFHRHPAFKQYTVFYTVVNGGGVCCENVRRETERQRGDSQSREPVSAKPRANSMNRLFPYEARTFCIFDERVARVQTRVPGSFLVSCPGLARVFSIVPPFGTRSGIIDDRSTPRAAIVPRFSPLPLPFLSVFHCTCPPVVSVALRLMDARKSAGSAGKTFGCNRGRRPSDVLSLIKHRAFLTRMVCRISFYKWDTTTRRSGYSREIKLDCVSDLWICLGKVQSNLPLKRSE